MSGSVYDREAASGRAGANAAIPLRPRWNQDICRDQDDSSRILLISADLLIWETAAIGQSQPRRLNMPYMMRSTTTTTATITTQPYGQSSNGRFRKSVPYRPVISVGRATSAANAEMVR